MQAAILLTLQRAARKKSQKFNEIGLAMKAPAGKCQNILYLDYDGVLHPEDVYRHPRRGIYFGQTGAGHALFENCDVLIQVLAPYPEVRIALST